MLDKDSKKNIDDLCDILVAKFPIPQDQVEQITVALTYKFMSDMDSESLSLGGKKSFFINDWEDYSWDCLFNSKTTGEDRRKKYKHVVEELQYNPNLPILFRNIFSNPPTPLNDKKILSDFLKIINLFSYENSETLGNAYEYLLSKTGAQGELGQFRTPRHIIDFIVNLIDPKSYERILDPACGTAGFLVSAYKHITSNSEDIDSESLLTLSKNIQGFDIEPKMIRTSLVNMFLQGFNTPNIKEYDLLSDDTYWNEYFDIILANPPFFTPKGGIKPHKRFTFNSSRAEVLFISYIFDHLRPNGRAGIIVPDGILFKNENAYIELRRQIVKNGLIGVISLPSGIFEPYSDTKTSILILDKKLVKEKDSIFYAEVRNDGFSLNSSRIPIEENDLPKISQSILSSDDSENLQYFQRSKLLEEPNINLRDLRNTGVNYDPKLNLIELGEICDLMTGGTPSTKNKDNYHGGNIKWLVSGDIHKDQIYDCKGRITSLGMQTSNTKYLPLNSVLIALNGKGVTRGKVAILRVKATCNQSLVSITPKDENQLLTEYLYVCLRGIYQDIRDLTGDKSRSGLNMKIIRKIKIPLISIKSQKEIISKFDAYQKVIEDNKKNIEEYNNKIEKEINLLWGK